MKKIQFSVNGKTINGMLYVPKIVKDNNPAILFIHGWTSAQKRFAMYMKELAKRGYICMSFDMEGHGETGGELSYLSPQDFLNDVTAAYDYLAAIKEVDKNGISVVGSSFGAYLGSILSSIRKVKNIVLRVPADYMNKGFEKPQVNQSRNKTTFSWRATPHKPKDSLALSALNKFNGKILIVESEKDELVDRQTVINYVNAANDKNKLTHIIMKNAPHSINHLVELQNEFKEILVQFFK